MYNLVFRLTSAPDYRKRFYAQLTERYTKKYILFAGDPPTVKTDYSIPELNHIKNYYFFNNQFLIQLDAFWLSLVCPSLVIDLNPRILSNWFLLVIRKLLRKRTVLWGHAWPRQGMSSSSDRVRSYMRVLSSKIILYTQAQVNELKILMPKANITYAPNAIYFYDEMQPLDHNAELGLNVIYVGRLHPKKKPRLAIHAFAKAYPNLSLESKLVIVGYGDDEKNLMLQDAENLGIVDKIIFTGYISDHEILRELYHQSFVSVSPGYVGLSVTQSLGFGVPMIIADNEPHAPEIECAVEGENCVFFRSDDISDFAEKISCVYSSKMNWSAKKDSISRNVRDRYCVEKMVEPFLDL